MKEKQLIEAIRDYTPEQLLELYKKAQQKGVEHDRIVETIKKHKVK